MFDAALRRVFDPPLNRLGAGLAGWGVSPTALTLAGFGLGLLCLPANALGAWRISLCLLAINRMLDGLDGAVARHRRVSDIGGFLDIVCDFLFYGGFVFGLALQTPQNGLPGAFLLFSFTGTATTFLAFAVFAAKRGYTTEIRGRKSLYYLGGLTEGAETVAVFVAMLVWPAAFGPLCWGFGLACWITTAARMISGWQAFRDPDPT